MPRLLIHPLPSAVDPAALVGGVAVVIDLLRATTTITTALAAGAREVLVALEPDEALRRAELLPAGTTLLGGERGGVRIAGFDLGNSPSEYTPERVRDKTIVFTTTNGTRALAHCQRAHRVILGALVNLSAVVTWLAAEAQERNIHLVCAGTRGKITAEDLLCAGAIASRLAERLPTHCPSQPSSDVDSLRTVVRDAWEAATHPAAGPNALIAALRLSQGGQDLLNLGLAADLEACATIDRLNLVAEYHPSEQRILPNA